MRQRYNSIELRGQMQAHAAPVRDTGMVIVAPAMAVSVVVVVVRAVKVHEAD